jgi:hypothetical protein
MTIYNISTVKDIHTVDITVNTRIVSHGTLLEMQNIVEYDNRDNLH